MHEFGIRNARRLVVPARGVISGAVAAVPALLFLLLFFQSAAIAAPVQQLVVRKGKLPETGRIVLRSGLAWTPESDELFETLSRSLDRELAEDGLVLVATEPSRLEPLPAGIESVRNVPVPRAKGGRQRRMSLVEAASRMQAMQLAREGKLPQTRFGSGAAIVNGAKPKAGGTGSGAQAGRTKQSAFPPLSRQEMIRFALSQESGLPELRGQYSIPGRVPAEIRETDPAQADYALVVRYCQLLPAGSVPSGREQGSMAQGLATGWHLLELACYDLAPARNGKAPREIWSATVQRVVHSAPLRATLPGMARAAFALEES
ncbi:hypothetical protein LJC26_02510 [Desulfovibrio sp. OttesenSCG-928-O18]|nr:hypothetical protein [Desulfovibrio sp. OttesenSCG-928-O18]